ncbi:MAG: Wzz/FepE/Etk N-terminal domain-containing protein [Desulfomonilaceae bacterium]|jgi:capsular exopolysaccharide synthesis family protein
MSIDKPVPQNKPGIGSTPWDPSAFPHGHPPFPYQYSQGPGVSGYGQADDPDGSTKNFKDYLDVIIRRRMAVLLFLVVAVIVTILYLFYATPLYTSVARLEIIDKKDKSEKRLTGEDVDPRANTSTQIEILKSKTLGEAVVDRMKLAESKGDEAANFSLIGIPRHLFATISAWIKGASHDENSDDKGAQRRSALGGSLAKNLQAKPVRASNLLEVSITATSPQLAHDLLTNYLDTYLTNNLEKRRGETLQVSQWLRDEANTTETKLRTAESKLLDFAVDHSVLLSADGALGQVMSLLNKRFEGQWRSEETKLKAQALKDLKFPGAGPAPSQADQTYVNKLREEHSKLEADYTQMRGVYSPTYPKMVLMKRKMKFLEDKIAQVERNVVSGSIESAEKEENLYKVQVDEAKREVTRVKALEAEFSILKKEVESNSEFLKLIMKEIQETDIKGRTISNNMVIVDQPTTPRSPSWPKKDLVLLIGLAVGLIGGVGCAFVWESMDDTIQNPDDLSKFLHIRRLGVIPDVSKTGSYGDNELSQGVVEFLAYSRPKTPLADSLRNLQMSILFSNPGFQMKSFCFSSALPSEGKTLLAVSFASILCSGNSPRVVVVDMDLRKPRIHSVFGVPGTTPGISNVLSANGNAMPLSEVIHAHNAVAGLYFVTSGPVPSDSVSLLHSFNLKKVIDELYSTFDYVVFDCPPVLGFPDTPILARFLDGVVLVARQGYVGKNEVAEAIDQVTAIDGVNLLGLVFNRTYAPALYGYGYKYGYRYRGHYYHQSYKYYHDS